MSLYDISKLVGPAAIRGVSRDMPGPKAEKTSAQPAKKADQGVAVQTGAKVSAGSVPVDSDRVETIRQALREGSYPLVPAQISDAIIAARHMLSDSQ